MSTTRTSRSSHRVTCTLSALREGSLTEYDARHGASPARSSLAASSVKRSAFGPLLVVHGVGDRQVPLEQAQKMVREARSSPQAVLRLFDHDEGGVEHVNGDLFTVAIDAMADWVADVLVPPIAAQAASS